MGGAESVYGPDPIFTDRGRSQVCSQECLASQEFLASKEPSVPVSTLRRTILCVQAGLGRGVMAKGLVFPNVVS
jgi:hypothetical protein